MIKLTFLVLFCIFFPTNCEYFDYEWKDYTGDIPADAVIAGRNASGELIYIGQAYYKGWGIIPTQIDRGVLQVHFALEEPKTVDTHVKIMCGRQEYFHWMETTNEKLEADLMGKYAVVGGHQDDKGLTYVGRVKRGEGYVVGQIATFLPDRPLWWSDGVNQEKFTEYEVMVYNPHYSWNELYYDFYENWEKSRKM